MEARRANVVGLNETNSSNFSSRSRPKTTLGLALDGTEIMGMTPLGAAAQSRALLVGDLIEEVDGIRVDDENILECLKGCDIVGSPIMLAVRRPSDMSLRTVTLIRQAAIL